METRTMLTATPVGDINEEPVPFEFFEGIHFQDKFIFSGKNGNDLSRARDLWIYDSATGLYHTLGEDVEDDGVFSSLAPAEFTVLGNFIYFRGQSASGSQLWRLNPAADNGNGMIEIVEDFGDPNLDANPSDLTVFDGKLYFQAYTEQTGTELFVFDPAAEGSPDQTKLVADLASDSASSSPSYLTGLNGKLYFRANDGQSGEELWVYDPQANGGTGGVSLAVDMVDGPTGSSLQELTAFNGKLYFQATTADFGEELWEFDPAANGGAGAANILSDIFSGTDGSLPEELTVAGGKLYFRATDPAVGTELFEFDPVLGVRLAWDVDSRAGESGHPEHLSEFGGKLYFQPTGGLTSRMQIWEFDPQTSTGEVTYDVVGSSGLYSNLMASGGKLYFQVTTYPNRRDIYQYDPILDQLVKLTDPVRTRSSSPEYLTELNGIIYFKARSLDDGIELWQYDPQANNGQGEVTSITGGTSVVNSAMHEITALNGAIYFRLALPLESVNLYRYVPGSNVDPQLVLTLPTVDENFWDHQVTVSGDRLYFVVDDGQNGSEVWEYNPQPEQGEPFSRRITNLTEDATDPNIELQFSHDGNLYFLAGATNRQVYRFDPTANNGQGQVSLVEDLSAYEPSVMATFEGAIYFQQGNDIYQYDVDSTSDPNEPKLLGNVGTTDMMPASFVSLGSKIYFLAESRYSGNSLLYEIDPNAPSNTNTLRYTGIANVSPFGAEGRMLIAQNDRLIFSRSLSSSDYYAEIWEMFPEDLGGDGVPRRVTSINNDGWAAPHELILIDDDLYFVANADDIGQELFVLPFNPAPNVQGETYVTNEDVELVIDATSLLDNDSDPEGQALSTSVEVGPAHGTLTLNPDGTFRYLPDLNYFGTDEFTYLVTDEGGTSKSAQVQITINAQPDPAVIQGNLMAVVNEDQSSAVSGLLSVVDPDVGEAAFQVNTNVQGNYGVFSIQANGFWTYQLNTALVQNLPADGSAFDTFQLVSLDGTATETFSVTIQGRNDIPALGGTTTGTTSEETTSAVSGSLTISDADQGESFFIPQTSIPGGFGTFSVTALGNWSYQLDNAAVQYLGQGVTVQESFPVTSLDQSASIIVQVTITGENDPPSTTIHAINGFHVEQQVIHIPVSSTDADGNNSQFTYAYQVIRLADQQTVDSGTATNVNQLSVAVATSGDYRIEITTTDSHGGQTNAQRDFVVGPQSTVELSISRDQDAVPGTLQASAESDLAFHEWDEAAGHLWFNVEEGLPNQPFDFTFKLTKNSTWLGDPQVLNHLGTDLQWTSDGSVFTGTLTELDLTGYQVGDRVLVATLLLPKDLENAAGMPMDGQGNYPQATMQTGISLTSAQADPLHPFAIQTANNAEFRPVIYDANDDGRVGLADFAQFISHYGQIVQQDSPDTYRFDYDVSGKIGLSDFALFLRHYGARKSANRSFDMPVFDQQPSQSQQPLLLEGESIPPTAETSEDSTEPFILPVIGSITDKQDEAANDDAPPASSDGNPELVFETAAQIDVRLIDAAFQSEDTDVLDPSSSWDEHLVGLVISDELEDSVF